MIRPSPETLDRFVAIVGENGVLRDDADKAPYLKEWRDLWHGATPLVLRPQSTDEVSRIMALATETRTAIVPQSGNTGLVGGQIPDPRGQDVLLSLNRMTKILALDQDNFTITAQAGATLQSVQHAAAEVDRLFPLSLASEGSCCIGGNLSSNAGGVNVMAYGNARDLCLGLEVVLPNGEIISTLKGLRKDNTGYDLRSIFIGAEGTLGVITAAALKLFPRPRRYETAFIAVPSPEAAVRLLGLFKNRAHNSLVSFELIAELGIAFVHRHMAAKRPLADISPWYVLTDLADPSPGITTEVLADALEQGLATDAVVAQSEAHRAEFWALRENMSESQKFEGGSIKHDVSVPISKVPAFIDEAMAAVSRLVPGCRYMCFGHLGDGNIHFNVSQPLDMDKQAFLKRWQDVSDIVHGVVLKLGGSISAEHGIGVLKRQELLKIKTPAELAAMRAIKKAFDPLNIMNPGKLLPD